jgi:hypothetical protein
VDLVYDELDNPYFRPMGCFDFKIDNGESIKLPAIHGGKLSLKLHGYFWGVPEIRKKINPESNYTEFEYHLCDDIEDGPNDMRSAIRPIADFDRLHNWIQQYTGSFSWAQLFGRKEAEAPAQCIGILDMLCLIWANNSKILILRDRIRELYRPQEHSTWMDAPQIIKNMFFVFPATLKQPNETVGLHKKAKKRKGPISVDDDVCEVIPDYSVQNFQDDQILNAEFLVVDWDELDRAAEKFGLDFKWRETYYDPSGKYDSPNMRLYLAAIQR